MASRAGNCKSMAPTNGKSHKNVCTSCGKNIMTHKEARKHPALGVLQCVTCHSSYTLVGDLSKYRGGVDLDGQDNYCRWCLDGGELLLCNDENCRNGFCYSCIERNLGSKEIKDITQSTSWYCFICDESQLKDLRQLAENALKTLKPPVKLKLKLKVVKPDVEKSRESLRVSFKSRENPPHRPKVDPPPKPTEDRPLNPQDVTPLKAKEDTPSKPKEDTLPKPKEDTLPKPKEDTPSKPKEDTLPKPKEDTLPKPKEATQHKPKEDTPSKSKEETLPKSKEISATNFSIFSSSKLCNKKPSPSIKPTKETQSAVINTSSLKEALPSVTILSSSKETPPAITITSKPTPQHFPTPQKPAAVPEVSTSRSEIIKALDEEMEMSDDSSDCAFVEASDSFLDNHVKPMEVDSSLYGPISWALKDAGNLKQRLQVHVDAITESLSTYDEQIFIKDPKNLSSWLSNIEAYFSGAHLIASRCRHINDIIMTDADL